MTTSETLPNQTSFQACVKHHASYMLLTALAFCVLQTVMIPAYDASLLSEQIPRIFLRTCEGWFIYLIATSLLLEYLPFQLPLWLRLFICCVIASPFMVIILLISWLLGLAPEEVGLTDSRSQVFNEILSRLPRAVALGILYSPLWILINYRWYRNKETPNNFVETQLQSAIQNLAQSTPAFISKVEEQKRGNLIAISAEEHYVRIYTTLGDSLILMRFSDALEQVSHLEGIQTHRSHWVAADAVVGTKTDNRKQFLILNNGVSLPVSRSFQTQVREKFNPMGV